MTTVYRRSSRRRRHRSSRSRLAVLAAATMILAATAFVLTPTGHLNSRDLVKINDVPYSVPPGSRVQEIVQEIVQVSALVARPGSSLDLTGDVVALGQGAPAERQIDGTPLLGDPPLADGSLIVVHHGQHRLEEMRRKVEEVSFETVFEGTGAVVSLVRSGAPGRREIYWGVYSGKQAAVVVVSAPQDAVVRRSSTTKPGQKLAALTFDDGPGTHTQAVLDALADKHVPATFFVLGGSAAANRSMIQKIKAAGHEVENHTWSHPILTQLSSDAIRSEISRTNDVIGESRFLRPPYGIYNAVVAEEAMAMGLRIALWTVDTLDWKYPSVDSIMSYVKAQTKPGAIILMHDGGRNRAQTVAAIPVIVDWLFANGYSLTTLEGLL